MGRQDDLRALNEDQFKELRFFINAIELDKAPDGYKENLVIQRHSKFKGITTKYSKVELSFYEGAGYENLKTIYETTGIDSVATILIQKYNFNSGNYDDIYLGEYDFTTYKEDNKVVIGQVIEIGFKEIIKNRSKLNVNLLSNVSVDGDILSPIPFNSLKIPEQFILNIADWDANSITDLTQVGQTFTTFVDLELTQSNIIGAQDTEFSTGKFIDSIANDGYIVFTTEIEGNIVLSDESTITGTYRLYKNTSIVKTDDLIISTSDDITHYFNFSFSEFSTSIASGDTFKLQLRITLTEPGVDVNQFNIDDGFLKATEEVDPLKQLFITSYQIYESFLKISQLITGNSNPFKSDFFGRTDTPLTTYTTDGELANIFIGKKLRGLEITSFATSLDNLFDTMNSIYDLGLGVEKIGGVDKVVIEDIRYFFNDNVILDISDRIDERYIKREVIPEYFYNSAKTGYNKFDYEANQGLEEYNISSLFSLPVKVIDNEFNNIVKLRGDTRGMMLLRQKPIINNPTEDVKGDDDIFILKTLRDGSNFIAETDEDFSLVEFSLGSSNSYNLKYTPKRNLLRKGRTLRSGLKYKESKYIKWQTSDKNSSLKTQLNSEISPIVESEDILISSLENPFILNEYYIAEGIPLYDDEVSILRDESINKGLIKYSPTKFGWIEKIETDINNTATIKVIAADLDYVTPIIT
jgi:hypothetical protein